MSLKLVSFHNSMNAVAGGVNKKCLYALLTFL